MQKRKIPPPELQRARADTGWGIISFAGGPAWLNEQAWGWKDFFRERVLR
jgi:hypothetical protein